MRKKSKKQIIWEWAAPSVLILAAALSVEISHLGQAWWCYPLDMLGWGIIGRGFFGAWRRWRRAEIELISQRVLPQKYSTRISLLTGEDLACGTPVVVNDRGFVVVPDKLPYPHQRTPPGSGGPSETKTRTTRHPSPEAVLYDRGRRGTPHQGRFSMTKSAQEWFLILDDKLHIVGPRGYPDVTVAIHAADNQAPWPTFRGRLVVRSNYDESGVRVGDGQGRIAAIREEGRWSGPEARAGSGYLVDPLLNAEHEREVNLPRTTKAPAQLQREIEEALRRPRRR